MNVLPMIPEDEACERMRGLAWLVSHGGVASEALCRTLGFQYPKARSSTTDRPVRGAVCHFPYPLPTGPSRALYVYGSLLEAIVSQHPRHPDNAAKLHNDEHYPRFYRVEDLLSFDDPDPFGVAGQFERFSDPHVDYPILLVRYDRLEECMPAVCEFLGVAPVPFERKPRRTSLDSLDMRTRERLVERYGPLAERMSAMPPCVLIPPKAAAGVPIAPPGDVRLPALDDPARPIVRTSAEVAASAISPPVPATPMPGLGGTAAPVVRPGVSRVATPVGVPSSADLLTCWTDLVYPARRLSDARLAAFRPDVRSVPARVKQPTLLLDGEGAPTLYLNVRYDFAAAAGQAYMVGFRLCPETFRPLDQGTLADIPNPNESRNDGRFGPEDQRIIRYAGETLLSFNMENAARQRRIFLHRVELGRTVELTLRGRPLQDVEKNWMPFVVGEELRFVYRVDPLVVIRLLDLETGVCEVAHDADPTIESVHGRCDGEVHGGTELRLWRWPYYIGFVHSCAPWRPMLVVLDAERHRWVHIGRMFDVPKPPVPEAEEWRRKSVQFPASLAIGADRLLVGMEYEDRCPALLSMPLDFIERVIPG